MRRVFRIDIVLHGGNGRKRGEENGDNTNIIHLRKLPQIESGGLHVYCVLCLEVATLYLARGKMWGIKKRQKVKNVFESFIVQTIRNINLSKEKYSQKTTKKANEIWSCKNFVLVKRVYCIKNIVKVPSLWSKQRRIQPCFTKYS